MTTYTSLKVALAPAETKFSPHKPKHMDKCNLGLVPKEEIKRDPILVDYFNQLNTAIEANDFKKVRFLLSSVKNPAQLVKMTEAKTEETFILKVCKKYVATEDENHKTQLLLIAVLLIHHGADINQGDKEGINPLFFACRHLKPKLIHFLLKNNAEVDQLKLNGYLPVYVDFFDQRLKGSYKKQQTVTVLVISKLLHDHVELYYNIPEVWDWWDYATTCLFVEEKLEGKSEQREIDITYCDQPCIGEVLAELNLNLVKTKHVELALEEKLISQHLRKAINDIDLVAVGIIVAKNPDLISKENFLICVFKKYLHLTKTQAKSAARLIQEKNLLQMADLIFPHLDIDQRKHAVHFAFKELKPTLVQYLLNKDVRIKMTELNALIPLYTTNNGEQRGRAYYKDQLVNLLVIIRMIDAHNPLPDVPTKLREWHFWAQRCSIISSKNGMKVCQNIDLLKQCTHRSIAVLIQKCQQLLEFSYTAFTLPPTQEYYHRIEQLKANQIRGFNRGVDLALRIVISVYKFYNHFFGQYALQETGETNNSLLFNVGSPLLLLGFALFLKNLMVEKYLQSRLKPFQPEATKRQYSAQQEQQFKLILTKSANDRFNTLFGTPLKLSFIFFLGALSTTKDNFETTQPDLLLYTAILHAVISVNRYLDQRCTSQLASLEQSQAKKSNVAQKRIVPKGMVNQLVSLLRMEIDASQPRDTQNGSAEVKAESKLNSGSALLPNIRTDGKPELRC